MTKRPKILLTNDDGIHAPGIRMLWESLKKFADVTVVAPSKEQSATSVSITLREPLHIEEVKWDNDSPVYSVSGTPADCVKLGLSVIMKEKPDFIASGINRGSNAGRNVLYSGTVAGAIEGVLHDIPSLAFSCIDYTNPDYEEAGKHIEKIFEHAMTHPLPFGTLLNINFPSRECDGVKGYKMARQGKEFWAEDPLERAHPVEKHTYYWLGAKIMQYDEHEESDIHWLRKGFVTAVPVHVGEMTDHAHISTGKSHFEGLF